HPLARQIAPYDPKADPFQNYRNPLDRVLSLSQIYVKVRNRYFLDAVQPGPEGARGELPKGVEIGSWGIRQYRLVLDLLVDATRDIGATPVLVTEATLASPGNDAAARARIHYEYQGMDHEALLRAFTRCYDVMRSVGRDKHVEIVDAAAV